MGASEVPLSTRQSRAILVASCMSGADGNGGSLSTTGGGVSVVTGLAGARLIGWASTTAGMPRSPARAAA